MSVLVVELMQQFHPPGFGQRTFTTSLGVMAYYTPTGFPWRVENDPAEALSPLVFLHSLGGGSSAYEWSKVYPAFAASHWVIAPDLIGWGQSTHPAREYRPEDYIGVIVEMLDQIGTSTPLIATSLTAGLAIRVAIARPDRVQSLFLVCPSGYSDFGADYRRGLGAQLAGIPFVDRLLYSVGAANEVAIRNFMQQFLFANPARITDEMVAAYLASALQSNAEYAALSSLKGSLVFDLSLYMTQLTTPTAFVWGAKTRFNTPALGKRLASLNPEAVTEFYELPDVGVLPHLELPAVVVGVLQSWLSSTATA